MVCDAMRLSMGIEGSEERRRLGFADLKQDCVCPLLMVSTDMPFAK